MVTSRLVERGVLRSGMYGIERNFGNIPVDYNESAFLQYTQQISENKLMSGGLYMPCLLKKSTLERINYYPEGNIKMNSEYNVYNITNSYDINYTKIDNKKNPKFKFLKNDIIFQINGQYIKDNDKIYSNILGYDVNLSTYCMIHSYYNDIFDIMFIGMTPDIALKLI